MGFLLQNYIFKTGQDPDNEGILIPRYVASGRTAPNGKVYPEVSKRNEFDLVPVRSIITKTKGDLDIITPDLFSNRFLKASFPEGSAVGLSAGTSFSESTTQGILGLKHGGHERVADTSGNLYAPKNCTLIEDGKWLILKSGRTEMKYPRPDNWVGIPQESYKEGDLIGSAYHTTSPVYALNAVIKLMNAKGSNGTKYFEKDQVINADCYAYFGGKIRYEENKRGEIEVFVGDTQYVYSPNSLYYYPEGTEIKPLQRICSGVVNMRQVTSDLGDDISSAFNIFRNQYYMLMSSDFSKTGIVSPGDMPEEILEMVFAGLTRIVRNPRTDQVEEIDYLGTQKAILDRESFFTTLSFGWAGKIIDRAVRGDMKIKDDIMTNVVLGLLLHDKLDNATKK